MSIVSEILQHNRTFIERKEYEAFRTDQFPNKKLVVLTCMDTRLVELLPRAMGFRNGDVKLVKTAGARSSTRTTASASWKSWRASTTSSASPRTRRARRRWRGCTRRWRVIRCPRLG